MGWILGPLTLIAFAYVTYYTATLLSDYYRSPAGRRNYTYIGVVRAYLGRSISSKVCLTFWHLPLLIIIVNLNMIIHVAIQARAHTHTYGE